MLSWLAIGSALKSAASASLKWLTSLSAWQLLCLGLACFAVVQHFTLITARHDAARWQKQYNSEHSARLADRQAYQKAQADAAQSNKAQVQKIEQSYQRNSDDERQAYLRDLAQLRADRMRRQAPPGSPGPTGSPAPQPPASGTDGNGLQLSPDQYLQAQEIELRLMHLQDWVEKQISVDPNK
jgi:hypothetical protein